MLLLLLLNFNNILLLLKNNFKGIDLCWKRTHREERVKSTEEKGDNCIKKDP